MKTLRIGILGTLAIMLLISTGARAQNATSVTLVGVVKDASGGVLPGVTVEAASPALIEKVRTVVTDADGRYRLVDLRPGVYSVTFTLPGFRTERHEGLELNTGFTATVNGALAVGGLEETITVTSEAPVVDVQGVTQQQNFSRETLRALPIGKNAGIYVALIPGASVGLTNQDVGGNKGESAQQMQIHGGRTNESFQLRDGMYFGSHIGLGGNINSSVNPATQQEVVVQVTGGLTAESLGGGTQVNVVSRDGGNTFHGTVVSDGSNKKFQGNNLSDELRTRNVATSTTLPLTINTLRRQYDAAAGFGGPIRRDRLWFFASGRALENSTYQPGNYYNKAANPLFYEPDLTRQAYDRAQAREGGVHLTFQATQKNKFGFTGHWEKNCNCQFGLNAGTTAPEAAGSDWYSPLHILQGNWTRPATNRLLFEVGVLDTGGALEHRLADGSPSSVASNIAVQNSTANYTYGGVERGSGFTQNLSHTEYWQRNVTASMSYVTGAQNFKVGMMALRSARDLDITFPNAMSYVFTGPLNNPRPAQLVEYALPTQLRARTTQTAIFAQEQRTLHRATLNLGVRYEAQVGYVPATSMAAGPWIGARSYGEVKNVPNWKDINPRVGVAYDLFGDGKTALKANIGRFLTYEANGGIVQNSNPSQALVLTGRRTWNDNGDFVPQESELGPVSPSNFGTSAPAFTYDPSVSRGWGTRGYNWQGAVSVQHQLAQGVSMSVGYFRTWYGNFQVTDNLLVDANSFDSYCITGPSDNASLPVGGRLPGGGGEHICGLLDLKPGVTTATRNVVYPASKYGKQSDVYNGLDFTMNARFGASGTVLGGLSTGRQVTNNCDIVAKVPELGIQPTAANTAINAAPNRFCNPAAAWQTQVKLSGSYELPYAIRASVNYQNIPGVNTVATFNVSPATITAALGRAPNNVGTQTVQLIEPTTLYREKRLNQVNLALSRSFSMGTERFQPRLEIANLTNANTITAIQTTYGATWQNVVGFLSPRIIKFGVQWDF
jgi:hypothetical protein